MRFLILLLSRVFFVSLFSAPVALAQEQLWVSIYYGKYPDKPGSRVFSTSTTTNQLQRFRIQEGQTLVVNEKSIAKIPVSHSIRQENDDTSQQESVNGQHSQLIEVPVGLYLTPRLLNASPSKNQKVTLSAKVVRDHNALDRDADKEAGIIRLNQSIETETVIMIGRWFQLSDSQQLSHQPALNRNSRVVATRRADAIQQSLWIKVDIAPSVGHPQ